MTDQNSCAIMNLKTHNFCSNTLRCPPAALCCHPRRHPGTRAGTLRAPLHVSPLPPLTLTDCNSWAGTDRRCRCETLRTSDGGGPKIQTAQNNNTNWPHRDHKRSSERHRSEPIRTELRDLVEKRRKKKSWCDDCGQYCNSLNPQFTPKVLVWICFVKICFLPALYSDCYVMDFHIYHQHF